MLLLATIFRCLMSRVLHSAVSFAHTRINHAPPLCCFALATWRIARQNVMSQSDDSPTSLCIIGILSSKSALTIHHCLLWFPTLCQLARSSWLATVLSSRSFRVRISLRRIVLWVPSGRLCRFLGTWISSHTTSARLHHYVWYSAYVPAFCSWSKSQHLGNII